MPFSDSRDNEVCYIYVRFALTRSDRSLDTFKKTALTVDKMHFSWPWSAQTPARLTRSQLSYAMQTDLPCFYSDLPGTRARRLCFGRTTSFSGRRSRECGFVDDVALCLEHYRIAKGTSNKCCVLFDSARCRGSLRACPERLFAVLDDIVGQPAAFLCRSHLETIDSMEQVTAHPLYRPPAKRSAIESQAEVRVI